MHRRSRGALAGIVVNILLACLGMVGAALPSAAQSVDCVGLRRQIAALERGDGGRTASYMRSAQRQQAEIDRTLAYRRSLGCDRQGFAGFGDAPADCGRIDAQIDRMNANLANLQQYAAQYAGSGASERADLIQQYAAYCGERGQWAYGDTRAPYPGDGALPPDTGFRRMPLNPEDDGEGRGPPPDQDQPAETRQPDAGGAIGGPKAVCVKTCDGSFFPVSYSASRGDLASLEALCHASCPNAETKLYTYDIYTEITQAIDKEGASYAELPNAQRYTKVRNSTCSCRAPGKSWLATLTEAERLYAGDRHDVVVTQQMSDASARPTPAAVSQPKPRSRKSRSSARRKALPETAVPSVTDIADDATAKDAKAASQVPTASHESAGIDVGQAGIGGAHGTGEGTMREILGPDGKKRRVRVVAPDL